MDRSALPWRRNCEGYFLSAEGKILAKDSGKGFLLLPGGGCDDGESPKDAVVREAFEETGAVVSVRDALGELRVAWGPSWAKTAKQKERYSRFQGDHMFFFSGSVDSLRSPGELLEDYWGSDKFLSLEDAILVVEGQKPFPADVAGYYEKQLRILRAIKSKVDSDMRVTGARP